MARTGGAWIGRARQARRGQAWQGSEGHGRRGAAGRGQVWRGMAGVVRRGVARPGEAGRGRQGEAWLDPARHGKAGQARRGEARLGKARKGMAGAAGAGGARCGRARQGMAGMDLTLDDSQLRAVKLMQHAPIATVTGGPGVGKTTITRAALESMPDARVLLCAPTGKAAARLSEATGREASTIHRLLGYRPGMGFTVGHIDADLVIVDESSMLDIELAGVLLAAIHKPTRLILIGDSNQLPPVGPGQPFADLVSSPDLVPCARLDTLHRAAAASWIARNAPRILAGGPIEHATCPDFEFYRVDRGGAMSVSEAVVHYARNDLRLQVLTPQRIGQFGCDALCRQLQGVYLGTELADDEPRIERKHYTLRAGDRVIVTSNIYSLGVFNGDVGTIVRIEAGAAAVDVFDPLIGGLREVVFSAELTKHLQLAYALTVHKSQGSQFDGVLAVVHSSHTRMLNRRLLYTALTRTRGRVVLVGDDGGLKAGLSKGLDSTRNTTLIERLRGQLDDVLEAERD